MQAAFICLAIFSLVCLLGAFASIAFCMLYITRIHEVTLIQGARMHEDAAKLAASQHEAGAKYSITMVQVAEKLLKSIDDNVRARVKFTNAIMRPQTGQAESEPIEEAPPMPDVFESKIMDDFHEISRDFNRMKNDDAEYSARELGIGQVDI